MPPIQVMIKPSSGHCNLECEYCFYYDEMQKREIKNYGYMSLATLEVIVKKTFEYAHESCGFAFQGGEPTLVGLEFYRQLLVLQKKYNHKSITVSNSIQTNGTRITKEWAAFFAENHFLVGISVDGIKSTHDAYRVDAQGNGTFETIKKAIERLDEFQVNYNILTVVNQKTANKISEIYDYYKKNKWNYIQYITCLDPLGEERGIKDYALTPERYGTFMVELFDRWYLDVINGNQPFIRQFENYIAILLGMRPESCEQSGQCFAQFIIEADGCVYPCDFYVLDEYKIGNLWNDSIDEIIENKVLERFVKESLQEHPDCFSCKYRLLCKGGCRRNREIDQSGALGKNYFCSSYQYFFEKSLPKMVEIASWIQKNMT